MTVKIELEDDIAAELKARAIAGGMSLEHFLQQLAQSQSLSSNISEVEANAAVRDFDRALDEFFLEDTAIIPPITSTYSREDIYFDHD